MEDSLKNIFPWLTFSHLAKEIHNVIEIRKDAMGLD